ncbi:MAG TPA: hypothetical protein DCM14_02860 [Clostridiales bacterium UBA8153]|nr:hypothetical protein [Clostridiales bacterium UBA8153]
MLSKLGRLVPSRFFKRGRWVVPVLVALAFSGFIQGLRGGFPEPAPLANGPAPPVATPQPTDPAALA